MTTQPDEQISRGGDATVPLAVHLRTIELKNAERDAAYQAGYSTGFADGLETGLRATLAEARAALGVAA